MQKVKVSRNRKSPPKQQKTKTKRISNHYGNKVVHHGKPGEDGLFLFLQQYFHFVTHLIKYLYIGLSVYLCHGAVQMIQIHIDLFSEIWSSLWETQHLPLFSLLFSVLFTWLSLDLLIKQGLTNCWAMKGVLKLGGGGCTSAADSVAVKTPAARAVILWGRLMTVLIEK